MFEWKKSAGKIYTLPVESIRPSPFQARTVFDEKELAGLAQSIRENGLLQPISVRKVEGGYELVAGERRLREEFCENMDKAVEQYASDYFDTEE